MVAEMMAYRWAGQIQSVDGGVVFSTGGGSQA
jgi:hypothetical protein